MIQMSLKWGNLRQNICKRAKQITGFETNIQAQQCVFMTHVPNPSSSVLDIMHRFKDVSSA